MGPRPADLVLHNGTVITLDPRLPRAQAVAITGGRISAVGDDREVLRLAGPTTQTIDLGGRAVVPGFIDAHVHAAHYGLFLLPPFVPFTGCRSLDDLLTAIARRAEETPPGEWVFGSGYLDFDLLREGRFPDRWELDRAVPHHPFLLRVRGHLAVVNSLALQRLGIARDTPDPPGGYIFRDERGEPTGWLLDNAVYDLVLPRLPPPTTEQWEEAVRQMEHRFLEMGVTSVVNQSGDVWPALQALRERGELAVRWQANLKGSSNYFHRAPTEVPEAVKALGPPTGTGDPWLRVGAIGELHADGLVEGAWMHEPFAVHRFGPGWRGLLRHPPEVLLEICRCAARQGFQMEVHASGDRALDLVLDIYERVDREVPLRERRWVITHGGVFPSPRAVERARRLGVIISTQQGVLWTQSRYYRHYWGERRASNLFALRTWLEGGVAVNGSSDIGLPPLRGIYMCVTRRNFLGEVLGPEQAISREEALRLYTLAGAYTTFEEKEKGSVEVGKRADLAVLSDDPLTVPEEHLKDIQVVMTLVDGRVAYRRKGI